MAKNETSGGKEMEASVKNRPVGTRAKDEPCLQSDRKVSQAAKEARATLIKEGIINEDNTLHNNYKHGR